MMRWKRSNEIIEEKVIAMICEEKDRWNYENIPIASKNNIIHS